LARSKSFSLKQSCVGIVLDFEPSGVGNRETGQGGQGSIARLASDSEDEQGNPLWGASRLHGELLMLGIEVAQSTVSKYMARSRAPPSQGWKTLTPQSR
jgi:hypothetical protein